MSTKHFPLDKLLQSAPDDLEIITQESPKRYSLARKISNSRFGALPLAIAYCQTTAHVQWCVNLCRDLKLPFRVRSGGHQHEGMSSGNNVFVIALSELFGRNMDIDLEKMEAWIPVGKPLQEVYNELEKPHRLIIPGGGCQSVNIGGITQGGGWGRSIRQLGYTCDAIVAAEIVLADGKVVTATKDNEPELFWSLKGGGGGNFGVVTRFRFKLSKLADPMTSFTFRWTEEAEARAALKAWTRMHLDGTPAGEPGSKELDRRLSSSCSLAVLPPPPAPPQTTRQKTKACAPINSLRVSMGGQFYGPEKDLRPILEHYFGGLLPPTVANGSDSGAFILNETPDRSTKRSSSNSSDPDVSRIVGPNADGSELEPELTLGQLQQQVSEFMNPTTPEGVNLELEPSPYTVIPNSPSITCDMPHPHKITSAYPRIGINHDQIIDDAYDYLKQVAYQKDVSRYLVWHCLGGAVADHPESRAVPFADRPYLLQAQSWWSNGGHLFSDEDRTREYVKWINVFRAKVLAKHTEGAFINFVDRDLVKDISTDAGRLELLRYYYGENLERLCMNKAKYDPKNLFNFAMSIPPV